MWRVARPPPPARSPATLGSGAPRRPSEGRVTIATGVQVQLQVTLEHLVRVCKALPCLLGLLERLFQCIYLRSVGFKSPAPLSEMVDRAHQHLVRVMEALEVAVRQRRVVVLILPRLVGRRGRLAEGCLADLGFKLRERADAPLRRRLDRRAAVQLADDRLCPVPDGRLAVAARAGAAAVATGAGLRPIARRAAPRAKAFVGRLLAIVQLSPPVVDQAARSGGGSCGEVRVFDEVFL
mmetsp:Transcript_37767/g.106753  ORF Transcript_37767/g.106753 Transcript_37767/m.106753 type:complete len:237 (-) Transcript_37767:193-903(-)